MKPSFFDYDGSRRLYGSCGSTTTWQSSFGSHNDSMMHHVHQGVSYTPLQASPAIDVTTIPDEPHKINPVLIGHTTFYYLVEQRPSRRGLRNDKAFKAMISIKDKLTRLVLGRFLMRAPLLKEWGIHPRGWLVF